jgi:hypothetical protein
MASYKPNLSGDYSRGQCGSSGLCDQSTQGIDRRLADSPVGLCHGAPEFHTECSVRSVLGALFDFFEKCTESGITMK